MPDGGPPARSLSEGGAGGWRPPPGRSFARCAVCCTSGGYTVGHDGNVSPPAGEDQILVPPGWAKGRLRPGMLVEVRPVREVLEGKGTPSLRRYLCTCWSTGSAPDVRAVVHAHPPMATAFAVCRRPLRERYPHRDHQRPGRGSGGPLAPPIHPGGAGQRPPLVRDHSAGAAGQPRGPLTWGPDLWSAFDRMETVEQTARIYANVQLLGAVWS